jgi:glycine/D-amino acid oxidase-like deaminating enzyme
MSPEPSPNLSDEYVIRSIAGLRPFRDIGFRLELERFSDKHVIHNYGHGGAGVTMCWGSAMEVADIINREIPNAEQVAILGGGVIGLTTALVLCERGLQVRLLSDRFTPHTTSDVAGGRWAPTLVEVGDSTERQAMFRRILERSLQKFIDLIDQPYGIWWCNSYVESGTDSSFNKIPDGILQPPIELAQLPFGNELSPGSVYRTLMIEPPIFMPRLMSDCQKAGIALETRRFEYREELQQLPEPLIVNCTGLGARNLFADEHVIPIRGQLVLLQPQNLPWLVSHRSGYCFPRKDSLVLGGTAEYHEYEAVTTEQGIAGILRGNRQFFGTPQFDKKSTSLGS